MTGKRAGRRGLTASLASLLVAVMVAAPAMAAGANTTPETQSRGHGVSSSWTISWSGTAPLDWRFDTNINVSGYANPHWTGTAGSSGSTSKSTAWYPCQGTVFQQKLRVVDAMDDSATDFTTATEAGGNPC